MKVLKVLLDIFKEFKKATVYFKDKKKAENILININYHSNKLNIQNPKTKEMSELTRISKSREESKSKVERSIMLLMFNSMHAVVTVLHVFQKNSILRDFQNSGKNIF